MIRRVLVAAVLVSTGLAFAAEEAPKPKKRPATRPAATQAAVVPYPLKTCVVSDEEFGGDMGDPYVFTHEGREIKLCCKSCLRKFNKDPEKFLKKLDVEAKKQADGKTAKKE